MNILHLITSMDRGGAENHLAILSKGQQKLGNNVHIIYLKGNDYWRKNLNKSKIKMINLEKKKINFFKKIFFIRNYIKKNNIDNLHAHLPHMEILAFCLLFFFKEKINFIITKHVDNSFIGGSIKKNKSLISDFVTYVIFLRANKIIAISKSVKKYFQNNFFKNFSEKIKIIYYGIDKDYMSLSFNNLLKLNIKKKNEIIYAFVGRLVQQKQVDLIIKSFHLFIQNTKTSKIKLLIVGNGPEKQNLKSLVGELKLKKHVKFLNHISDVSEIFKKIDVFCMNTKFEGLGLVMLEAMYFSVPIIAPKISAIPEVIEDRSNGILVKPNDVKEYSKAMQIMTKSQLRNKYSRNSKKILNKKFNTNKMVNHTMRLYKVK